MFGGLIACQARVGVPVTVVAATDGDAAYDPRGDADLGRRRAVEQALALETLGVTGTDIVRLGLPDGMLTARVDELVVAILDIASSGSRGELLLVAPWVGDVHPDHEACGVAAERASAALEAELASGLFWTWHRRLPVDLDALHLACVALDDHVVEQRRAAVAEHRSQFDRRVEQPILTDELAEPTRWHGEYYIRSLR